mgnify:CR=1 FL=1
MELLVLVIVVVMLCSAVAVLLLAKRRGTPVSLLPGLLPARFTASDRLQNFPTELSRQRIDHLAGDRKRFETEFPGLGEVVDLDTTDGLRITLRNDEIVHLRPSGNAPELRCYTEADSADRAARLNAECLALIDNWRR